MSILASIFGGILLGRLFGMWEQRVRTEARQMEAERAMHDGVL